VTGPQQSSRPQKHGASGEKKPKGEKRFVKTKLLLGAVVATGISLLWRDRSARAGEALNGHEFLVDETRRQRPGRWQQSQGQADFQD